MPTLSEIGNFFEDPMGSIANVKVGGSQVAAPVAPTPQANGYQYQGAAPAAPIPQAPQAVAPQAQPIAPAAQMAPQPVAPQGQPQPLIPGMQPQPMTIPQAGAVNQGAVTPAVQNIPVAPEAPILRQAEPTAEAGPVNPQAPVPPEQAPTQAQPNPTAEVKNEQQMAPDAAHVDDLLTHQDNPAKLTSLGSDPTVDSEAVKKIANKHVLGHLQNTMGTENAQRQGDDLIARTNAGDPKASRDLAKALSAPAGRAEDEGSYLKAYLFHRFGLSDLAKQEQIKLGAGSSLAPIKLSDGTDAVVRQRADGVATYGVDRSTGRELTAQQLQEATGMNMPGAETSKSLHQFVAQDGTKHVVSVVTGKNGQIRYRDDTDGKWLANAPAGMEQLGHEDYLEKQANMAKRTIMSKMRGEDQKHFAQTGSHLYSEQDILDAGDKAYIGQTGGSNANAAPQEGAPSAVTTILKNLSGSNKEAPAAPELKNNNPGNIRYGDFARSMGATGQTPNGIAIFPNRETGDRAHDSLLGGSAYKNMTLGQIIGKWAPNNENNPAEYYKTVKGKLNGIDMDKTYAELTPEEKQRFRAAQTDVEHGTNMVPAGGRATENKPAARVMPNATAQAIEDQAQAIYEGRQPMPTGLGANNYRNQAIANRVQEIAQERGAPYNATKYKSVIEPIVKDFSTGKSKESVDSLKTAFNHIDELEPAIKELNNGRFPAANAIVNRFATAVGGSNATTVEQIGPIVGNEIEKTWNPRMGTEAERHHLVQQFSSARSPEQLQKAVDTYKDLMMGKVKPLEDRYNQTGNKDFWSNQIADPTIKQHFDRWQARENVRHGQAPSGTTTNGIKFKVVTQ